MNSKIPNVKIGNLLVHAACNRPDFDIHNKTFTLPSQHISPLFLTDLHTMSVYPCNGSSNTELQRSDYQLFGFLPFTTPQKNEIPVNED